MKATVDALVQVALYSAAITAGILLFRFIFKNRISSKLQYLMWWLLILRLLMPVTPDIGLHFNLQDMRSSKPIKPSCPLLLRFWTWPRRLYPTRSPLTKASPRRYSRIQM